MIVDHLDLVAVALGPARVHALEHLGPVLALGAAGAGIDLDIGVVGVGLAGEQGGDLVALGALGELGQSGDGVVDHRRVALGLGHLHQLGGVGQLLLDRPGGGDRLVEAPALAHHHLRRLGIVPQFRVLDLRVELGRAASARGPSRGTGAGDRGPT